MYKDMLQWWLGIFIAVEVVCLFAYCIHKERTDPQSEKEEQEFYQGCERYIGKKATEILKQFI